MFTPLQLSSVRHNPSCDGCTRRDAGTGVHYGVTAPLPFERGGNGA